MAAAAATTTATAGAGFNAGIDKVANASDKKGGTLKFVGAQDADSWDTTARLLRLRLGLHALLQPPAGHATTRRRARRASSSCRTWPRPRPRSPTTARPTTYDAQGRPHLGGRQADHLQGHQVRHRAQWAQDVLSGGPVYLQGHPRPGRQVQGPVQGQGQGQAGPEGHRDPGRQDHHLPARQAPTVTSSRCSRMPSASPVRQDKDTKSKYGLKPFSSGPYKFQSYTPNKNADPGPQPRTGRSPRTRSARRCRTRSRSRCSPTPTSMRQAPHQRRLRPRPQPDRHGPAGPHHRAQGAQGQRRQPESPASSATRPSRRRSSRSTTSTAARPSIYGADHKSLQTARGGPHGRWRHRHQHAPAGRPGPRPELRPVRHRRRTRASRTSTKAKDELKAVRQAERLQDHHRRPQQQAQSRWPPPRRCRRR